MFRTLGNILIGMGENLVDAGLFWNDRVAATWALVFGVLYSWFKKYLFGDVGLLPWLGVIVMLDTWAGYRAAKALYKQDPTVYPEPTGSLLRDKLAAKLTSYVIALIALNAFTNFEIGGARAQDVLSEVNVLGWEVNMNLLRTVYYTAVVGFMGFELKSIRKNLRVTGFNFLNFKSAEQLDKIIGSDDEVQH